MTGPRDRYHSLARSLCFFPLPCLTGVQQNQRAAASKLAAAAAGGFGLGWAGLGCAYYTVPVGSLPGRVRNGGPVLGMDDGTRLLWLPFGSPSKLFRVWCGLVWSSLYLGWPFLSLLWICRLQRECNETDGKSAQQMPVGLTQGRKRSETGGPVPEDAVDGDIFIRGGP